jgi:hypothetical protein
MGGDLGYFFVFPSRGGDEGGIGFPPDRARIWQVSACLFSSPSRARIKVGVQSKRLWKHACYETVRVPTVLSVFVILGLRPEDPV